MKSISNGVCMILVSLLLVQCTFSQNAKDDRDDFIAGKDNNSKKENQEERIEFISMNDTLVGYLSKPRKAKIFPVVVILHSASHGNHDFRLYTHLKETLTSINIGVFSYDRRGSGESQGNFNSASFKDLAKDALSAIDVLSKRNDIIKNKIGLYGVSQGGWLAPLAYNLQPENISFMILVSSCGVSPAKQMEYSAITTLQMQGYSTEVIKKAIYLRQITDDFYRGLRERQNTQQELNKFKHEEWFNEIYLPITKDGNLPEDIRLTKWIHELDFNPSECFEKIRIPLALFYGESDRWVPINESMKVWKAALSKAQNSDYTFFSIKKAGHMMIINEDQNPTQEIISSKYSDEIKNWILKVIELE